MEVQLRSLLYQQLRSSSSESSCCFGCMIVIYIEDSVNTFSFMVILSSPAAVERMHDAPHRVSEVQHCKLVDQAWKPNPNTLQAQPEQTRCKGARRFEVEANGVCLGLGLWVRGSWAKTSQAPPRPKGLDCKCNLPPPKKKAALSPRP